MRRRKPSNGSPMWGCSRGVRTSWTARTTIATDVKRGVLPLLLAWFLSTATAQAQGVREHTRPATGTVLTETQAADLTLTLSTVSSRLVQTWIRTAGTIDPARRVLVATVPDREAPLVKVGQRVRAF